MEKVSISLEGLQSALNSIFDNMRREESEDAIPLVESYYWAISDKDLYNVDKSPAVREIGNLSEDWEFLESVINDKQMGVRPMLAHIAPLLVYLSQR